MQPTNMNCKWCGQLMHWGARLENGVAWRIFDCDNVLCDKYCEEQARVRLEPVSDLNH